MGAMTSQITSVSVIYSTDCLGGDQRMNQSSASLAFVRGIHWWPVNSPHKGPVTRKMFPFDDVTMYLPWTPHIWPMSSTYGMPFVSSRPGRSSTLVTAIICCIHYRVVFDPCFAVVKYPSVLPIFFRTTSLIQGQSHDFPTVYQSWRICVERSHESTRNS